MTRRSRNKDPRTKTCQDEPPIRGGTRHRCTRCGWVVAFRNDFDYYSSWGNAYGRNRCSRRDAWRPRTLSLSMERNLAGQALGEHDYNTRTLDNLPTPMPTVFFRPIYEVYCQNRQYGMISNEYHHHNGFHSDNVPHVACAQHRDGP